MCQTMLFFLCISQFLVQLGMIRLGKLWHRFPKLRFLVGISLGGGLGYGYSRYYLQPRRQTANLLIDDQRKSVSQDADNRSNMHVDGQLHTSDEQSSKDGKTESQLETLPAEVQMPNAQPVAKKQQNTSYDIQVRPKTFHQVKQIRQWNLEDKFGEDQFVLILSDLPFVSQFQAKIIKQINQINLSHPKITILRKDLEENGTKDFLENKYKLKMKKNTLFLLKNSYDKTLTSIEFDMFTQYPKILQLFLSKVNIFNNESISILQRNLQQLKPEESCLIFLIDEKESQAKKKERLMAAKFIEMQLLFGEMSTVRFVVADKQAAVKSGLVDQANSKANSLHLYRKHNIYTPFDPNYYLKTSSSSYLPYHRLANIRLFEPGSRNLMIPSYLSGVQTFDSSLLGAPFLCILTIDRNRISQDEYASIIKLFGQMKRKNLFPNVAFTLRLKPVSFAGSTQLSNKDWQITLTNIQEIDRQNMMNQITQREQIKLVGFNEANYLRNSNEYLYEHSLIDFELVHDFILKASKNELPQYYKTEEKGLLGSLRKLVSSDFQQTILDNDKDHLVFEYSEFCPTCKQISPIVDDFARIVQQKGLGLPNLQFHRIDANKNRTKTQLSSPYIPNIYYYRKEWKQNGPVRFPIDFFAKQGILNLFEFCAITQSLKSIDWRDLDIHIGSHTIDLSEFPLSS